MTWARAEDTAAHLKTVTTNVPARILGRTNLTVSGFGFGSYRISEYEPAHREALRLALESGVNLIDTSTNYGDGGSERLIGDVLQELFTSNRLRREQVVIVTKVGYLQGSNLREAKQLTEERRPFPETVEFSADCWHNISPEFLEDQISRSLSRLQLECIDVLLLHNPEYFLKTSMQRDIYYARIKKAFEFLETEVARKRIRFYGISSNTFPEASNKSDFTSLDRIWSLAGEIKKHHHFAVIQFPMNIFESGACLQRNNGEHTVLERAREYRLGTLINRPLNAFHRGRLIRLTSFPTHDETEVKARFHTLLGRVVETEKRLREEHRRLELNWGHLLRQRAGDINDLLQWKDVLHYQLVPQLDLSLRRLGPEAQSWADDYRNSIYELFSLMTQGLENLAEQKSALLAQHLEQFAPALAGPESLSRKALRVYHSLKGVNCVLVGMRNERYVKDILQPLSPIPEEQALSIMTRMPRTP